MFLRIYTKLIVISIVGVVAVVGDRFVAVDVTFRNTAGPEKHQAVAVRNNADGSTFYRCSFEGYQDTLYVHSLRQFYRECDIFGNDILYIFNSKLIQQYFLNYFIFAVTYRYHRFYFRKCSCSISKLQYICSQTDGTPEKCSDSPWKNRPKPKNRNIHNQLYNWSCPGPSGGSQPGHDISWAAMEALLENGIHPILH